MTLRRLVAVLALVSQGPPTAGAQPGITSAARTVTLNATRVSSISIAILSGAVQSLPAVVDNAINPFAAPVRITTSWSVSPATSTVRLLAYFNNAAQALANGTSYIASSRLEGQVLTLPTTPWQPVTWTPFTQNSSRGVGVNGASLRLMRLDITPANQQASRTIDLDLRLNLSGQAPLVSGTYTGTVTLRAFTT